LHFLFEKAIYIVRKFGKKTIGKLISTHFLFEIVKHTHTIAFKLHQLMLPTVAAKVPNQRTISSAIGNQRVVGKFYHMNI
jgi:hypothetical protein